MGARGCTRGEGITRVLCSVRNNDTAAFEFQALLHTYLAAPAIERVRVAGARRVHLVLLGTARNGVACAQASRAWRTWTRCEAQRSL